VALDAAVKFPSLQVRMRFIYPAIRLFQRLKRDVNVSCSININVFKKKRGGELSTVQ
jgi:hypothetical protein